MKHVFTCRTAALLGWAFLGLLTHAAAQSTTTGALTLPATICAGTTQAITVPFSTSGVFTAGNVFTAQLSNSTGTFTTFTAIGTVAAAPTAASTQSIAAIIPNTVAAGSAYRVRVVASAPASATANLSPTTVAITPIPGAPVSGKPVVNKCLNDAAEALQATPSAGGSLIWYGQSATGGTPSGATPTPATAAATAGTVPYYVSQTVGSCESSSRTRIDFTVNALPNTPTASSPAPYCQGVPVNGLTATVDAGSSPLWYTSPSDPAPTGSLTPSNQTSGTYYVRARNNATGCISPAPGATVTVTINGRPGLPAITAPAPICAGGAPNPLVATPDAGGSLRWYGTSASGGTATTTPPATSNTASSVIYVSQVNAAGCESTAGANSGRAAIPVTVNPLPAGPALDAPPVACVNRIAPALTASGTGVRWYDTATGTTALPGAPVPPTSSAGPVTFYASQVVNGCESAVGQRTSVTVTVNPVPAAPTVNNPAPYCAGQGAAALPATGTALLWYGTAASGGSGSSVATVPGTAAANVGTTSYYVTQTVGGCESNRQAIAVVVKRTPGLPTVPATSVNICQNYPASPLQATAETGATLNWYISQTGGTPSATAPTPPTTTPTTVSYYVSQTLDGCESGLTNQAAGRTQIQVTVNPTPGVPTTTAAEFCNNGPAQPLQASPDAGATLNWFDPAGASLGNNAPTPPTTAVGTVIYTVGQTNSFNCASQTRANLSVEIKPTPAAPGTTPVSYCQIQQDQPGQNVVPLTASGQNLQWYNLDGNRFPTAPTPTRDQAGSFNVLVSQTVRGCESTRATATFIIQTTPAPTVNPIATYCVGVTATPLVATPVAGGTLRWIDPNGRESGEAPTPFTITPTQANFAVYQQGPNGCFSARSNIRLVVYPKPTMAIVGPSQTVNLGLTATLQLRFTSVPPFSYTLNDGTTGTATDTLGTVGVTPPRTTIFQVANVTNACGAGLPGNPATATVTVIVPTITTGNLTTTSTTLCAGSSFSVPFTTGGTLNPGNVFKVQIADTTSKRFIDIATGTPSVEPITAKIPDNSAGGVYFVRVAGTNPKIEVGGSNSPQLLYIRPRPTATLTGNQDVFDSYPATLTITLVGDAPWTLTYSDSLRTNTVTTNVNPFSLLVLPARTTSYQLLTVNNICGVGTATGRVTVRVLPLLGVDDPLDEAVNAYPVPVETVLTVTIDALLLKTPAELTLTDGLGRPAIRQTTRAERTDLDMSRQPAGLYLLHIKVGDRQTTRKILKQ